MRKRSITLFMWGYQPHFRIAVQMKANDVLRRVGCNVEAKALLVGVRLPGSKNPNAVCVEPEDGEWPLNLFDGLLERVDATVRDHELQHVFYGDERSMQEKPEMIRRDSVRSAVCAALEPHDAAHQVLSFCGMPSPIDDYHVVPVVQIPARLFEQFPRLRDRLSRDDRFRTYPSLIHAALAGLLDAATEGLRVPEPGRGVGGELKDADQIIKEAATSFMHTPALAIQHRYTFVDLFERFNYISSLRYEGAHGVGHLILVDPSHAALDYVLRFEQPVPFREPRWARKALALCEGDIALIADPEQIYGLGRLGTQHDAGAQDAFLVEFLGHYFWELRCDNHVLLRSRYGVATLPQEAIEKEVFVSNYGRMFSQATPNERVHAWTLFTAALEMEHGCMIVVAVDAQEEARRLAQQGTMIQPALLTAELLRRVSGIDGTILVDPHGICHAVGVILDGPAVPACTPARGSRFNSAIRYISASDKSRLAIVVSDDHTVDILPLLRPQVRRGDIEANLATFEKATLDDYHKSRNWLDSHRFYLNIDQCRRANVALERLEAMPREVGEIYISTERFTPAPEMDDSYLLP